MLLSADSWQQDTNSALSQRTYFRVLTTMDHQNTPDNKPSFTPEFDLPKPKAKGFINPRVVKTISFTIISISLLICTVLSILAIWDFIVQDDLMWRAFSTMLVVALASWTFSTVNERFGD